MFAPRAMWGCWALYFHCHFWRSCSSHSLLDQGRDTWSLLYAAGSAGFILGTAWLCCRWRARLAANGFIQLVLLLQRDPRVGISPYALGGCAATAPAQVVPDIAVVPLDRKDWKHICSK